MASEVVWYRNAWWVRTQWGGSKKKDRRIGPTSPESMARREGFEPPTLRFEEETEPEESPPPALS